jgi:hypothetical protein
MFKSAYALRCFTPFIILNRCLLISSPTYVWMFVCCLFNDIEFRANHFLYTIAQYIKTSVDSTMIKIRNEKKNIYKMYDSKKKQKKKSFKSNIQGLAARPHWDQTIPILPIHWLSDHWRSQPLEEGRPKIKHNNSPFANASEKRRLQTNALKTKLKIPGSPQS